MDLLELYKSALLFFLLPGCWSSKLLCGFTFKILVKLCRDAAFKQTEIALALRALNGVLSQRDIQTRCGEGRREGWRLRRFLRLPSGCLFDGTPSRTPFEWGDRRRSFLKAVLL